jgi:hypothetical protein
VAFCRFTSTNPSDTQWVQTNGLSGGTFRSTDNGASWSTASTGLTNSIVFAFAVSPAVGGTGATNLFAGASGGRVFRSSNNGTSWSSASTGLANAIVYSLAVSDPNLFAGTNSSGVFRSSNNGISWTTASIGLQNASVFDLAVSPAVGGTGATNLFVGTDGDGIWRRPLSEIVTSAEILTGDMPTHFTLEQNYPNPFNPATTISFRLSSQSFVSLKVFDALGREISVLVEEQLSAGTYSRQWNAPALPSGVYFYRLQAGPFNETKKLILLR